MPDITTLPLIIATLVLTACVLALDAATEPPMLGGLH